MGSRLVVEPSVAGGTKRRSPEGTGEEHRNGWSSTESPAPRGAPAGRHNGMAPPPHGPHHRRDRRDAGRRQDEDAALEDGDEDYDHRGWSRSSSKIIVGNVPNSVHPPDLEGLLSQFGTIQSIEKINTRDGATQTVAVIFEAPEFAQQACQELNGYEYEGSFLKVEMASERRNRNRAARGPGGMAFQGPPGASRQTDFPLRILVQSDMVGAIIGRQGTTIRQITQQTRARVDVHRKDNVGSLEKAITIYGNPENCTNACKKILEVMQQEATNTNKGEITLKVLAHNNLIGRIIGKGGNTIKRIMQETDTKITVSSFNMERIITVKGSIENMSRAESMVSSKLRQSYENDLQAMAPQSMMFPGLHPMAMMSTSNMNYSSRGSGGFPGTPYGSGPASYQGMYPPGGAIPPTGGPPGIPGGPNDAQETTFLYIPNNAVGAIIGTKGTHIRNIIRFSGASVKIAPIENDKQPPPPPPPTQQNPGEPQPPVAERKVTIIGTPESQWKAQYLIFEKMREEGYVAGTEDVRLTVEILVPSGQVGRIIGKGGQNVRELQRVTGSIIKLPEQGSLPQEEIETTVHIIGPFFSVQSAQRRIRAMVQTVAPPAPTGGRPPRGGGGGGSHRGNNDQQ
ncbi:insulin-like growth factor 2 mRNA-binding protein 2 isoform X2 [Frankliniella occidentalis]|uniref:Insulin-like growth factor 2 mRNA-binding protein 2 isoform X2 n=1 Tax=Frankliniella occidentalis TaxID=133901 RepID=A0A9C6U2I2_FRAOC|nr:insulin-like growth factor 2 mRNA-binding protein 2 isoform X2 [Frankliniella occidentalis]